MQTMDASEDGVLKAIERMICQIYIPALRVNTAGWGELNTGNQGFQLKNSFLNGLESFANVLSGAQESLEQKVMLTVGDGGQGVTAEKTLLLVVFP